MTLCFRPLNSGAVVRAGVVFLLTLITGCDADFSAPKTIAVNGISGSIHGGQQPVTGSRIQLYAVGPAGDGSPSTALISATLTSSDGSGNRTNSNANAGNAFNTLPAGMFTISGDYTCPSSSAQVYLAATGGNPGLAAGTNNSAIQLLAALGQCGQLTSSTYVSLNELTTLGTLIPLAPYTTSISAIGSGPADLQAFLTALGQVATYTNVTLGTVPGPNLPAGYYASSTEIQTLGDILAACINSAGGSAGDGSICGQLFTLTIPPGGTTAPTNVLAAALSIVNNPTNNVSAIFKLKPSTGPFLPTLSSAPASWAFPVVQQVATPTFLPEAGKFTDPISVSLGSATSGAHIYYTTDGSTPTTSSTLYTGSAIPVTITETINALAVLSGYANSSVATGDYVIGGILSTVAGGGGQGPSDGTQTAVGAQMAEPEGVAVYGGTLYIADTDNFVVRKVVGNKISVFAGSDSTTTVCNTSTGKYTDDLCDGGPAIGAALGAVGGLAVDAIGDVYIADELTATIRKVTVSTGIISLVAGNESQGFSGDGNAATKAALNNPHAVAVDASGNVYIADSGNGRVRKVTAGGTITTFAGGGLNADITYTGAATGAELSPVGIAVDSTGNVYITDEGNTIVVRKITPAGVISTIAGGGGCQILTAVGSSCLDGSPATSIALPESDGLTVDGNGNVFIASLAFIYKVTPSGAAAVVAGSDATGYTGDGGSATSGTFFGAADVAVDASGNLYIADSFNQAIREVTY